MGKYNRDNIDSFVILSFKVVLNSILISATACSFSTSPSSFMWRKVRTAAIANSPPITKRKVQLCNSRRFKTETLRVEKKSANHPPSKGPSAEIKATIMFLTEIYTMASFFGASLIPILLMARLIPDKETPLKILITPINKIVTVCDEGTVTKHHPRMQRI